MPFIRTLESVDKMFEEIGLETDSIIRERVSEYTEMLFEELSRQRLTGEKTIAGIISRQIYDSLYIFKNFNNVITDELKLIDLGTGGGLPGIPLKIYRSKMKVYLLESNKKKTMFLKEVERRLKLREIYFLTGRAEEYGQDLGHREKYDLVVSKAVAKAPILAELTLPLVKIGGKVILYKGPGGREEMKNAERALELCGGALRDEKEYKLITGEKRYMYLVEKRRRTPEKYPRAAGKPKAKPLK